MKVPFGYRMAREDTANNLIQLRTPQPDKNIFVHWIDNAREIPMNENWLLEKVNWLASFSHDGYIQKADYYTTMWLLNQYDALTIVGLWQSDTELNGGPMRASAFRDPDAERIYVIYTNVYAPDRRKEPYLRELKAIVETFRSFAESKSAVTS